jgi:hypothetical protein
MNNLAGAFGSLLDERPFSLCKVFCRHFLIGKVTCLQILHSKSRLERFHFRWVLHAACPIDQPKE